MRTVRTRMVVVAAALGVALAGGARAADYTWNGPANGDWFVAANWSPNGVPGTNTGDTVSIASGPVILTNSTGPLATFTIAGATLTFTNWNSILTASNVTVQSGGKLTLPAAFTNAAQANNIYIVCTNLTVELNGSIDADKKGFLGRAGKTGLGPGGGGFRGGGGYGGKGGYTTGGNIYGSATAPTQCGSAGGAESSTDPNTPGHGGGAIRIEATGTVNIFGDLKANGGDYGNYSGSAGGSGGGIHIVCDTLEGNGPLSANGGKGYPGGSNGGGGGGHGGVGADNPAGYGQSYGVSNAPVTPGSSGGAEKVDDPYHGGGGGGAVWIEAAGTARIDGRIDADGGDHGDFGGDAGGAGGSIYLSCRALGGGGTFTAKGGKGNTVAGGAGAGGGGRIAIYRATGPDPAMQFDVAGGSTGVGTPGAGSIVWMSPPAGTIVLIR